MSATVRLEVNGRAVEVPAGSSVAAAIAQAGITVFRRSVTGQPRAPLCGMAYASNAAYASTNWASSARA